MSIRYPLVQPGMVLWQKKRVRASNANISRVGWFTVRIIDVRERDCLVSWNGNAPRAMRKADVEKLYRNKPNVTP